MNIKTLTRFCLVAAALPLGCATTTAGPASPTAQLYPKMGTHQRTVTTSSPEAQQFFDQGLNWTYAFNYNAAIRSFRRATELDPNCAMAHWGIALCNGPHINNPVMTDQQSQDAWDALQDALDNVDEATEVERELIQALAKRYAKPWPNDRTPLDKAYAAAMGVVWRNHPQDVDVGTLYAESLMDLKPWNLYTLDREPREGTKEIVSLLEQVIELDPNNPGANHLYIHAVEPSNTPQRALAAADRLRNMVPASGHLLHMPSHIDVLVGQWDEAITQNEKAMSADERYRRVSPKQRFQHLYMSHNSHMLAFAAMMSGREREALEAARAIVTDVPDDALSAGKQYLDAMMCAIYDVQKRFGRWDAILAEAPPKPILPVSTAMWRANRAIAYAAMGDFENATLEHDAFRRAMNRISDDHIMAINPARKVLAVANHLITGEIELQKGNLQRAASELEAGIMIEDSLKYMEPPEWIQPLRHTLGAVYLKDGRYADAERVYREDLAKWPNNGWSLYGLTRALEGQGKSADAARRQFRDAWKHADAPITTSCMCIPNA